MLLKLWETLLDCFKEKPYWSKIQPFLTLFSIYVITLVLAYQFIQWQYRISPSISLYFSSYIFKQITLVFLAIGVIGFILSRRGRRIQVQKGRALGEFAQKYARPVLKGAAVVGLILVAVVPLFLYFSPNKVSHIRLKFLDEPDFDKYAFVYLIYELNKLQRNWYFEIDFDVFDESILSLEKRRRCAGENKTLCYAEMIANDRPFIGITRAKLGEDFFWQNRGRVSVVSTFRWEQYAPPSTYEFLAYSIIVQSILIHLNAHCKGLPENAFKESRIAYGDLFQFSPRRQAMKATILAAHLSRKGEELLFNCFGVEYLSICSNLLTLEWLRSKRVFENLEKSFGVRL